MNTKICTSKEQSQKLIELGIDRNTADMVWVCGRLHTDGLEYQVLRVKEEVSEPENYIPAWSLSALLGLMPTCVLSVFNRTDGNLYRVVKDTDERKETEYHRNSIDAAFVMVCWLLENKKI